MNNKPKQQLPHQLRANPVMPLGLLDKTLPLTAATPPQLRSRRQFQFNGMQFETNAMSLHIPRSGLDGDAGDARFPSTERRNTPYPTLKPSPSSAASHTQTLPGAQGSLSGISGSDNGSTRMTWRRPSNSHLRQPGGRIPRRADSDSDNDKDNDDDKDKDNGKAGGEDALGSCNARLQRVMAKYSRHSSGDNYIYKKIYDIDNNCTKNNTDNTKDQDSKANDDNNEAHNDQEKRLSAARIHNRYPKLSGFRFGQMTAGGGMHAAGLAQSKMDYITLAGFLLGYLTSNVLFFLCWYFNWLKGQVVKLRMHFLGHTNLWEFFDFEDTSRYSMQTKLLLAPIILGCSILYCVVNILHLLIKLVRSDVPRTVIDFVQRIPRSHWP